MSRLTVFAASATLLMFLTAPIRAQSWEVSGLAGYTPSSSLDRRAPELNHLDISGGFTWGVQAGRFFTRQWGAEVLWMRQSSALRIGTAAGTADLFTMSAGQLQGDVVYRFSGADAHLQPFVCAGLGATFFRAAEVPSEIKLSLGFGAGVKYFFSRSVGVRAHGRFKPNLLNDTSSRLLRPVWILSGNSAAVRVSGRCRGAFLEPYGAGGASSGPTARMTMPRADGSVAAIPGPGTTLLGQAHDFTGPAQI
jgi:opacity protein-like surface antigen